MTILTKDLYKSFFLLFFLLIISNTIWGQYGTIDNPSLTVIVQRENGAPIYGADVVIRDGWDTTHPAIRTMTTNQNGIVHFVQQALVPFTIYSDGSYFRSYQGPGSRVDNKNFQFRLNLEVSSHGLQTYKTQITFLDGEKIVNVTMSARKSRSENTRNHPDRNKKNGNSPSPFPHKNQTYIELNGRWVTNNTSDLVYEKLQKMGILTSYGPNNSNISNEIRYQTNYEGAKWLKENFPELANYKIVHVNNINRDMQVIQIFVGKNP